MKKGIVKLIAIAVIASAPFILSQAQPTPGQQEGGGSVQGGPVGGGAPVGSGIALLVGLGLAYGATKSLWLKKKTE